MSSLLIVGKQALPANNTKELIAWLKANPDKATAVSVGAGSGAHVCGIYFMDKTGTRFQFAQYRGGKVAVFDTKTRAVKEWPLASPWSAPYDLVTDKRGDIWTAGMATDRVSRVDQTTGAVTEYQLPRPTKRRRPRCAF